MRPSKIFFLLAVLMAGLVIPAAAQRTRRPVRRPAAPVRRAAPAPKPPVTTPSDVTTARIKVSNQLSNVNGFIDLLGPVAVVIEESDRNLRNRRPTSPEVKTNEDNKRKVIASIRGLHAGLVQLETDFRTKTALKKWLPQIQGISELSAQSEDSAIAGKFVAAKEPLRAIAQKLADTFAIMGR